MKIELFLWTICMAVLAGCASTSKKQIPEDRYSGVYVAELVFDNAKQWDTLDVRKAGTGDPDSFFIFYADSYIKKLPDGQWTAPKFIHDTFPAVIQPGFKGLMVGDPIRMPVDSINGKPGGATAFRPMHIDTLHRTAAFGGLEYKKIR